METDKCIICGQVSTHLVWDKDEVPRYICGADDCYHPIKGASSCHQTILATNESAHY